MLKNYYMKENIRFIKDFAIILFIILFMGEITTFLYYSFGNLGNSIYVYFWIFLIVYAFAKFMKSKGEKLLTLLVSVLLLGTFIGFVTSIINLTTNIETVFLEKNYIATYGTSKETNPQTDSDVTVEHKTYVFNKNDNQIGKEIKRLENLYEDSDTKEFLFWQTAFTKGYKPKNINSYKGKDTFKKNAHLFFTVGLMFVVESFIYSFFYTVLLLTIPLTFLIFKKQIFENDIKQIIKDYPQLRII